MPYLALPQMRRRRDIVGVAVLLGIVDDGLAHLGVLCVLQHACRQAGFLDLLEVVLIVGAVGLGLGPEAVAVVALDLGEDLLLEDALDEILLAAVEHAGDEDVAAVDVDGDVFLLDAGQDLQETLVDLFLVVLVVDVEIVQPEAVTALPADAGDQLVDDEVLVGLVGDVHPELIAPVLVAAHRVTLELLVVGAVGLQAPDAHVGIDLAAAGLERLDLVGIVVLNIDNDRLVVLDTAGVAADVGAEDDGPFLGGCGLRRNGIELAHSQEADHESEQEGSRTPGKPGQPGSAGCGFHKSLLYVGG